MADGSFDGAGSGGWALVAPVFANVQDVLPSRGEKIASGINLSARPARVQIRYRVGITSDMRFVLGATINDDDEVDYSAARIMQIVSGPAEIGRRERLEFMAETYSPSGNPA